MAELFVKQAALYAGTRPGYPPELFRFISSKTPNHDLAWDVGTGNGQASVPLASFYKNVVGTDTSPAQLDHAGRLPNIRYQQTPPTMTLDELTQLVAPESSVDLVTVAQAMHWFDLPTFYQQVKHVLKRPGGVLAAWCYTEPCVSDAVDVVFWRLYKNSAPYWAPARKIVDDEYRRIEFPFEPVDGEEHTGPFTFKATKHMDLQMYLTYIRSWSSYQTAHEQGVELLPEDVVKDFESAWAGNDVRPVHYPVHLRIGRVM
ncbi:unnamed protein product [Victoria cruziana]